MHEKQVRKYGDDAMRVDPQMNLTDAATESFTRAYMRIFRGPKLRNPNRKIRCDEGHAD